MAAETETSTREPGGVDFLRKWFEEKGVRKVKLGAVDVDGVWRGKYISLDKFFSAAKSGLGFCDVVFGWDLSDELLNLPLPGRAADAVSTAVPGQDPIDLKAGELPHRIGLLFGIRRGTMR